MDSYRAAEALHTLNMLDISILHAMLGHTTRRLQRCLLQFSNMNARVLIDLRPLSKCLSCFSSAASLPYTASSKVYSEADYNPTPNHYERTCTGVPGRDLVATLTAEWSMKLLRCLESAHREGLLDLIASDMPTPDEDELDVTICPSGIPPRSTLCFPEFACVGMLSAFAVGSVAASKIHLQYDAIAACLYFLSQSAPRSATLICQCNALRVLASLNMKGTRLIGGENNSWLQEALTSNSTEYATNQRTIQDIQNLCWEDIADGLTTNPHSSVVENSSNGLSVNKKEVSFLDITLNVAARGYTILEQVQPHRNSLTYHQLISAALWCASVSMLEDTLRKNSTKHKSLNTERIHTVLLELLSCIASHRINSGTIVPDDKLQLSLILR